MDYPICYYVAKIKNALVNLFNHFSNRTEGGIPRTLHKIWLGNNPLPEKYTVLHKTWTDLNPNWKVQWWFEKDLAKIKPFMLRENYEWMMKSTNQAERSDILRLEILRLYGGLYVDTDVECLQPIDPILDRKNIKCFGGFECYNQLEKRYVVGTAVIGSVPNHPLIRLACKQLYSAMKHSAEHETETLWRIVKGSGPHFFTDVWEIGRDDTVMIFPSPIFYPGFEDEKWKYYRKYPRSVLKVIYPLSVTYHHWDNTWL